MKALLVAVVYCSLWQGIKTCSSPDGYTSHEQRWNNFTYGDDNRGNHWTGSHWNGLDIWTVNPTGGRRQ